jgi:hypothetical protein
MIVLDDVAKVAYDVASRDRTKPGGDEVTKDFEVIEHAGDGQINGVTMDLSSFSTVLHAIFAEGADYTKKSVESRLAVVEKLLGAKSLETVIQADQEKIF